MSFELATVLPFLGGAAILTATLNTHQHPGWPAAIAIVAFPVAIFCTVVSQSVNPAHAQSRALFPLYYIATVATVATLHHRARRRQHAPG